MGLEQLRIQKCCFCVSLSTACLIIAILSLLGTLSAIFGMSMDDSSQPDFTPEQNNVAHTATMILRGISAVVSILLCIVLIYATVKKNTKMMRGWLILKACECVLMVLLIVKIIYQLVETDRYNRSILITVLIAAIIDFMVCCYFWLVVWSHYLELGDEETANAVRQGPEGAKLNDHASSNC